MSVSSKFGRISNQLIFARSISISQPPTSVSGSNLSNTVTENHNIKDVELLESIKTLETAEFKALGNPQSILSVNSPPSVPVYVRRGSLLSIYGFNNSSISAVKSHLEVIDPFRRYLYGGYVSSYQKLISTTPFSLLISSISRNFSLFKKSENKTFVNLALDGSTDWAILNKDALQVFTGNSLNIGLYHLPSTISKRLSKQLNISQKTSTGLSTWSRLGYTLLTGRGQVGLVGNGSIYNINLQPGEELLINQQNLLGITVNGPYDLQNCVIKYSFPVDSSNKSELIIQKQAPSLSLLGIIRSNATAASKFRQYGQLLSSYFSTIFSYFSKGRNSSYNFLVGNQDFVKVIGPRNILLQSYTSDTTYISPSKSSLPPPSVDGSTFDKLKSTSSDYLSYVTVKPGKSVEFKSTPRF
ncbi:altered inheritance of mitochondria protein 24, mitochondrial [Scheffersomyces coipomensis]|uniref:altered inheritance of mitochondria protein 24, mitochondrial n=1 Tax=Scheffersomyces coipomensis TaxID=1788519 RepID=UPI00315CB3AF